MNYFVCVEGLLGVETNADAFVWSYAAVAPKSVREAFERCKIRVSIVVKNDTDVFPADLLSVQQGRFGYFAGTPESGELYYEKPFLFGKKLRYRVSVERNRVQVVVGKSYRNMVRMRIMNLHALRYVVQDIVSGLLLLNGYASLYCSAVHFPAQGSTALVFAPPSTGKTITGLTLCREYGAHYMSEDIAVTDGKTVWAVPWTNSFRMQAKEMPQRKGIFGKIHKILFWKHLSQGGKENEVQAMLEAYARKAEASATHVFVLEQAKGNTGCDQAEAKHKLLTLNRYLFHYHQAPVVLAFHYYNPWFSPEEMFEKEKAIMGQLLENAEYCCIQSEAPAAYAGIAFEKVRQRGNHS